MADEEKQEQPNQLRLSFPGGRLNLTGDTVKMLIPYLGRVLVIGMLAYGATVIIGAMRQ
jgi:hypothetical protein